MKKGFTLLEIIITLAIIGVVLSMVTSMGRGFSDQIRFANTKEEVTSKIGNLIQEAATTSSVSVGSGTQRYGILSISIVSGSTIGWTYSSGELTSDISYTTQVLYGNFQTSGFGLTLKPYAIGCDTASGGVFTLVSNDNGNLKACYETNAATCKLREVSCE